MNAFSALQMLGTALPTPKEMTTWDAASRAEFCIPESILMENASREAFHVIAPTLEPKRRILIIMGGGNNGGDGAALARHLLDEGHHVLVCHIKPLEQLSETVRLHALMAKKTGVPFIPLSLRDGTLITPPEYRTIARSPHLVVDALLGTGFTPPLRETELDIVRFINYMAKTTPVFSLDVPSGLDALTGVPRHEAVRASQTVTFEAAKTGMAFPHAAEFIGDLHVRRIGIPRAVRKRHPASFYLLAPRPCAWPFDAPDMYKGTAGHVLIFGGSRGLTGAPLLAALGALRAGAGLVTAACPGGLEACLRQGFPEIMTLPLDTVDTWSNALLPACVKAVRALPRAAALVVGPGMGRTHEAQEIISALIQEKNRPPMVLDADGLFPLGIKDPADFSTLSPLLSHLREDDCITPHPGEAARILGTNAEDIQAARMEAIKTLTNFTRATVVLKGTGTLIGRGNGPVFIAPFAAPSLAVGGSGDVLAGIIAAFIARKCALALTPPDAAFKAVCLGVHTHGKAGEMLDGTYPCRGALAREIADAVPKITRA